MTDLTEQEVCIGSLGQQKVYLHWSDVKDICTYAVSAAYEQVREENTKLKKWCEEFNALDVAKENAQLKELLKECRDVMDKAGFMFAKIDDVKKAKRLLKQIDEELKQDD